MTRHRAIGVIALLLANSLAVPANKKIKSPQLRTINRQNFETSTLLTAAPPPSSTSALQTGRRLVISYLLWFFLGLTGVHHLYLGRQREALVSSITLGGFILGWIGDAFRIPSYVAARAAAERAAAAASAPPEPSDLEAAPSEPSEPSSSASDGLVEAPEEAASDSDAAAVGVTASDAATLAEDTTPARLGLLSATFRLFWRLLWRYAFGRWLAFHLMRLMPDLVTDPTLLSKTTSALATPGSGPRRIMTALIQATSALITAFLTTAPLPPLTSTLLHYRLTIPTVVAALLESVRKTHVSTEYAAKVCATTRQCHSALHGNAIAHCNALHSLSDTPLAAIAHYTAMP